MNTTKRIAQFLVMLWLVLTIVPLLFGNFEGAAAKFVGVGGWVAIIVGIVAIVEKFVLISRNKSDAASRKASSSAHVAPNSYQPQPNTLTKAVSEHEEKCFLENEINGMEAEFEIANKSLGKQSSSLKPFSDLASEESNSLKPLGNLTYEEASRYFNEYCELLIKGCGIREKESCLPTSFDRMKEALKVECLNWCNLGGDFDENWELIGTGVIRLSCFVPDEFAEKTRKSPDSSNLEELKAYLAASRAAAEIIERRTNELNVEWNEFRKRYRTEQIPKSPSLPNRSHPQQHAPAVVSMSETKEATKDHVSPSAPDALGAQQNKTDGHDAMPVSFNLESKPSDAGLSEHHSDSCKASAKRSETLRVSVFLAIVLFLLIGILIDWNRKPTQTGVLPFGSSNNGSVEQESRNDIKIAVTSDFLEVFKKVAAERDAERQLSPKDPSADGLDRRTGNATASSSGRSEQIARFLKESINQMVALRNHYEADLGQIEWGLILNPEHLAVDPGLAGSKARIRKAQEIVDQYEKQVDSLFENMRNDTFKLEMSANEKAEAREAFERGTQESIQTRNQILQLEREIIWKCGEMIEYLYMYDGNWSVSHGQILFRNNEKAAGYNRYLDTIKELAAQLEQLRRYGE